MGSRLGLGVAGRLLLVLGGACQPAVEGPVESAATTDLATTGSTGDPVPEPDEFSPDPSWERWEIRAPGYAVPTAGTTYVCFGASFTITELRHIVAFVPVVDQRAVVHHMILYRSEDPLDELEPCYPGPPSAVMQWGWGPGGRPLVLPEQAGLPVGQQPGLVRYVLQIHYDNADGHADIVDRSGMDVYTTTELREQDAAIFALGDVASLVIPPGEPRWPTVFRCGSAATSVLLREPIHVFGSWLHAHELGESLWSEHHRDGMKLGELGRHDPYDFANQRFEPLDATVAPGDELWTYCYYDSTDQTEPVHGGGGTDDEMCLNYLLYHPAQPWLTVCNDG